MPDKKHEILRISRLLTPKKQSDLLTWVRLAYKAESSIRNSFSSVTDVHSLKTQDYSCENLVDRRKK